ncbi:HD-GYP domain-containing protein, partial [Thermodesulfobacteriota bacterium]
RKNDQLRTEVARRKQVENSRASVASRLEEALNGAVIALATMAEKRDPLTASHQRRVAQLAYATARAMGLPAEKVNRISVAAAVHDVGNIVVPSEILHRPGKINEFEYGMIRTHPQVGYEILREIELPWPLAEIIFQHHERLDGSGYPKSLRGDKILVEAQVIAVADVVEAMCSPRPYRPPLGIEKAVVEITQNQGILYDTKVVKGCVAALEKGFNFQ